MTPIKTARGDVFVYENADAVALAAADVFATCVKGVLADSATAKVALSGGSTPKALFKLLASPNWRDRIEWKRVEIFFADERCVPPDHADSNYKMARETLLDHVPLAADHVHRIAGERPPSEAATHYAQLLTRLGDPPRLDLLLLGMGPDGHTASLFPGTAVLNEQRALAAPVYVQKLESWRVTMTAPVLSAASHVVVTTVGHEKADALALALTGPEGAVPIQRVHARDMRWLVDEAAAQKWRANR
ncbi:MAG TPA: 6-phosphogluconolactonase [Polyangia bacterium]|jgi:6-phosphogluconolactonase|nr:6-phosphogluconolactonase [Polyangia bacterium]